MLSLSDHKVIVGLDYGMRRTGVALGNLITRTARPLQTIHHKDTTELLFLLDTIIHRWDPQMIVVGQPHRDKNERMNAICQQITKKIEMRCGISCTLHCEDLSSWEAEQRVKRELKTGINKRNKALIDAVSAQIILQSFLEEHLAQGKHL